MYRSLMREANPTVDRQHKTNSMVIFAIFLDSLSHIIHKGFFFFLTDLLCIYYGILFFVIRRFLYLWMCVSEFVFLLFQLWLFFFCFFAYYFLLSLLLSRFHCNERKWVWIGVGRKWGKEKLSHDILYQKSIFGLKNTFWRNSLDI